MGRPLSPVQYKRRCLHNQPEQDYPLFNRATAVELEKTNHLCPHCNEILPEGCYKKASRTSNINRHFQECILGRKFRCKMCGEKGEKMECPQKQNLENHLKRVHGLKKGDFEGNIEEVFRPKRRRNQNEEINNQTEELVFITRAFKDFQDKHVSK